MELTRMIIVICINMYLSKLNKFYMITWHISKFLITNINTYNYCNKNNKHR